MQQAIQGFDQPMIKLDKGLRRSLLCGMAACATLSGCRKTADDSVSVPAVAEVTTVSQRQVSPSAFLDQVFARYRSADSYCDRAVAKLSYHQDGRVETTQAPLHVWFDQDQLYVQAYDVQFFWDHQGMMAWIDDPQTNGFDSQVLRRPPSRQRPEIDDLFADPILRDRVAAGLAGPPPQLEWLFSEAPMQALFSSDHRFSFDNPGTVGARRCRVVRVQAGLETYRFWVDEEFGIVRRIDFPSIQLPPEPGRAPLRMTLQMDLENASFDASRQTPDHKRLPSNPKYVSRFIPLPPLKPPPLLGRQPSRFHGSSIDERIGISDRGSDRELTISVPYLGDEGSAAAVQQLTLWQSRFPAALDAQIRLVAVADEDLARHLSPQISFPVIVDRNASVSRALELAPGTLTVQDQTGRIVWIQSDLSESGIVTLGAVVADLIQGIDVPSRVRGQWKEQTDAYHHALTSVLQK